MRTKPIEHNMESHSRKEWARRLGISASVISKRLIAGETMADIVKMPRKYNKKKKSICTAISLDECFACSFTDCIRNDPVGGEASIIAEALGEEFRTHKRIGGM